MKQLVQYANNICKKIIGEQAFDRELSKVIGEMRDMIRLQMSLVMQQEAGWMAVDPTPAPSGTSPQHWYWSERGWYNTYSRVHLPGTPEIHPANLIRETWEQGESPNKWLNRYSGCVRTGVITKIIQEMKDIVGTVSREEGLDIGGYSDSVALNLFPERWEWHERGWYNRGTREYLSGTEELHPAYFSLQLWQWSELDQNWYNCYLKGKNYCPKDINPATQFYNWDNLSPLDWLTILSDILTMSADRFMYSELGNIIKELEFLSRTGRFVRFEYCYKCKVSSCNCPKIGEKYLAYQEGSYIGGSFVPTDRVKYNRARQVKTPDKLSDPAHWGNLGWMYVEFMKSLPRYEHQRRTGYGKKRPPSTLKR